jgi:hypothetical protein
MDAPPITIYNLQRRFLMKPLQARLNEGGCGDEPGGETAASKTGCIRTTGTRGSIFYLCKYGFIPV